MASKILVANQKLVGCTNSKTDLIHINISKFVIAVKKFKNNCSGGF